MNRQLVAFFVGLVFAIGLGIAGMSKPSKVINFLDISGTWDPSLAFVMVGAIGVFSVAYFFSRKITRPALDNKFHLPKNQSIDFKLLFGAALFGVGWGLGGFCPGPAFVAVGAGMLSGVIFFVGFTIGGYVFPKK